MGKDITISDQTFNEIEKFCHDIVTQDSRSTRIPYVYVIRDTKRVYGIEENFDNDGYVWMCDNAELIFESDGEFMDYIEENDLDVDIDLDESDTFYGVDRVYYKDVRATKNIFLTESAAQTHLESYGYQYTDPDIKVMHLSGNNEILGLITTLNEIIH